MQSSASPAKVPLAWATNGIKNAIPTASQTATVPNGASLNDGFPAITLLQKSAGGMAPLGQDFNGVLNLLSSHTMWGNAGGRYGFDQAFANAIGGYQAGAVLASATLGYAWLNTVDNNTSNPDAGGAGWVSANFGLHIANFIQGTGATVNLADTTQLRLALLSSFGQKQSLTFAQNGTFTVPYGVTRIVIEMAAGGGGAGGSSTNLTGGGGGGGGYSQASFTVTPEQVIPIVVGAAGAGGTAGNVGANGGSSSAGTLLSAGGGLAGQAGGGGTAAGGIGGTGSISGLPTSGGDGGDGTTTGAAGAGSGGECGRTCGRTRSGTGPRNAVGAGGGGAATYVLSNQTGGNGMNGYVKVSW